MKKIATDAAAVELKLFEEEFDVDLEPDQKRAVLKSITRGALIYDAGKFVLQLIVPIEQENGKAITEITIAEPDVGQIKAAEVRGDELATTLKLISAVSGIPLGLLDRMKSRDITAAGSVFGFFG